MVGNKDDGALVNIVAVLYYTSAIEAVGRKDAKGCQYRESIPTPPLQALDGVFS